MKDKRQFLTIIAGVVLSLTLMLFAFGCGTSSSGTQEITYFNDFSDPAKVNDWVDLSETKTWHYETKGGKGYYVQYPTGSFLSQVMNTVIGDTQGDITASATIQFMGALPQGFVLRRQDMTPGTDSFYLLAADRETDSVTTVKIIKYENGTFAPENCVYEVYNGTTQLDKDYRLEASITGNTLTVKLYDGDTKLAERSFTDPTPFTHGYVGFLNDGSTGRFSDFRVTYRQAQH